MFRAIFRLLSLFLLGWFAFMTAAAIYAATRRRSVPTPDPTADEVELVATFDQLDFASRAPAFRGGSVTTWFGGGTLDLRDATLDPAGATLNVSALFGGGQLIVPEAWDVTTKIVGIGGVGDARPKIERPADAPHLVVEGTAVFGGWGITSEPAQGRDEHEPVLA